MEQIILRLLYKVAAVFILSNCILLTVPKSNWLQYLIMMLNYPAVGLFIKSHVSDTIITISNYLIAQLINVSTMIGQIGLLQRVA